MVRTRPIQRCRAEFFRNLLRRQLAIKVGTNQYSVFDDKILDQILTKRPANELDLYQINGISAARLESNGREIISVILRFDDPSAVLPERPTFVNCRRCSERQVLANLTGWNETCGECKKSKDPRLSKMNLNVRLPTAKDFN